MRILDNGEYRDATPEEIAEWAAEAAAAPPPGAHRRRKIAALLAAIEGGIKDA